MTDLPLYCHPITAPLLPEDFPRTTEWNDGELLEVEPGLTMRAHFTPGHAPGHLAVEIPERKTLLAADLISSLSSIVIPSSNDDLPQYLDSLERMAKLGCHLVIPSHGPPYGEGSDPFGTAIAHRLQRERQVLGSLPARLRNARWARQAYRDHLSRPRPALDARRQSQRLASPAQAGHGRACPGARRGLEQPRLGAVAPAQSGQLKTVACRVAKGLSALPSLGLDLQRHMAQPAIPSQGKLAAHRVAIGAACAQGRTQIGSQGVGRRFSLTLGRAENRQQSPASRRQRRPADHPAGPGAARRSPWRTG